MGFNAFRGEPCTRPLLVVDVGYSAHRKSCGLYWTGAQEASEHSFGDAIEQTAQLVGQLTAPVLVLEAVLSTYHAPSGNPGIRGDFEQGRGWYYGAGILSFGAALRFLQVLNQKMQGRDLDIAEAFLSNKDTPTGHGEDAVLIHHRFWVTPPVELKDDVEPASFLIHGVPSIRVFKPDISEVI
jgi:hypothetical protein